MKKKSPSIQGLEDAQIPDDGGFRTLNAAFAPTGITPEVQPSVSGGMDVVGHLDPNRGQPMNRWLDSIGASDPGGAHLGGVKGLPEQDMFQPSPLNGLQAAQPGVQMPKVTQPSVQMGAPDKEMELRVRRARMVNQERPAANFYPHTGTYNPFPSS